MMQVFVLLSHPCKTNIWEDSSFQSFNFVFA